MLSSIKIPKFQQIILTYFFILLWVENLPHLFFKLTSLFKVNRIDVTKRTKLSVNRTAFVPNNLVLGNLWIDQSCLLQTRSLQTQIIQIQSFETSVVIGWFALVLLLDVVKIFVYFSLLFIFYNVNVVRHPERYKHHFLYCLSDFDWCLFAKHYDKAIKNIVTCE